VGRRRQRIPVASLGNWKPPEISEADWRRLEAAYGRKIPPHVRSSLQREFVSYAAASLSDLRAPSVAHARSNILDIRRSAQKLLELLRPSKLGFDAATYARSLLANHFPEPSVGYEDDKEHARAPLSSEVGKLTAMLDACVTACDRGLAELADPTYRTETGEVWARWVRQTSAILRKARLPVSARKDAALNTDNPLSPFARLVDALQCLLPQDRRRHTHSADALAKAIAKARS
jgi:hypothetical protein